MMPRGLRWLSLVLAVLPVISVSAHETLRISTPMPPPFWALLERQLLKSNEDACLQTLELLFDERGWLLCVERWGGDDGPDDAIENCNDWPILHALGASDQVLASCTRRRGRATCGSTRWPRRRRCRSRRTACTTRNSR